MNSETKIVAVIATFNEEEHLDRALASLENQEGVRIHTVVVNAGNPLSDHLRSRCREVSVPSDHFWTASNARGIDEAIRLGATHILFLNSDTTLMPKSAKILYQIVERDPMTIACSPAYFVDEHGQTRLQYSRDCFIPILVYNYLARDWDLLEQAPEGSIATDLAGGQGVLASVQALSLGKLDVRGLPHYRSDMDLWLQLKRKGVKMATACQAGVLNNRELSASAWGANKSLKRWMWFFFSRYAPESIPTMWRLRWKHVFFPMSILSFLIMVPVVWLYRLLRPPSSRRVPANTEAA